MQSIVTITTGLSGPTAGGIQESARIAWQALHSHAGAEHQNASLLCFGSAEGVNGLRPGDRLVTAGSKLALFLKLAGRRWDAEQLLFWHLGLLKLLPVMRGRQTRVVLFLHGVEAWRSFTGRARRRLEGVTLFLVNSQFTWQRFVECNPWCAGRPHKVVPLGCGEPAEDMRAPDAAPTVLMLGRLARGEDYKGHRELIAVWPRVRERVPDAQLWIAGDGDLRPELEQAAAAASVAKSVRFWGRVSEATKDDLLGRCRCFAMPSRGEGFGLVYLEAMRVGRPCLVSTCDAAREVVNPPEAGLAVDPKDAAALADTVCRLLTAGAEWQSWSQAARHRYETNFTANHFQGRLLEALFGPKASNDFAQPATLARSASEGLR